MNEQDYLAQLQALLPRGAAWPRDPNAVLTQVLEALAQEPARLHAEALALLDEADPRTTAQLLYDWERVAGLPSPCVTTEQSTAERRNALVARLTGVGGQSRQYFIDLATRLGFKGNPVVHSGTALAGSANTLTLNASAGDVDDVHKGRVARLKTGAGSVQERPITAYSGTSKVATVSPRWRTNEALNSDNFSLWQKQRGDVIPDAIVGPDGLPMDKFYETLTVGATYFYQSFSFTAGVKKVISIYAMAGEITTFRFQDFVVSGLSQRFDLAAGSVVLTSTGEWSNAQIEAIGGGLYRCSAEIVPSTTGSRNIGLCSFDINNDDGVSGLYVRGAQVETANELGDYIATAATPITEPNATTAYDIIDENAPISITEFVRHTCESDCEYPVYDDPWVYAWQVNAANESIIEATCESVCEDGLRSWGNDPLECAISALKPAHTTTLFAYS